MSSNLAKILKKKKYLRKTVKVSQNDLRVLEQFYSRCIAAYGSIDNLQKTTKLPRKKIENCLQSKNAHANYRQVQRNFPRLKVIAYDINEIWSINVAFVHKLAKYNIAGKCLLVAVDGLSRYLRVSPMRSKSAEETARTFKKMIQKQKLRKVWTDKGTKFKGGFKNLCDQEGIETYTTRSESKSAHAEKNIRSLKNVIYKLLEHKWTYHYINKLSRSVDTLNSRVNRVTKLAPNKGTKKHVPHSRSLAAEKSAKLVKKPRFQVGDTVRIAKQDLPFKKGHHRKNCNTQSTHI